LQEGGYKIGKPNRVGRKLGGRGRAYSGRENQRNARRAFGQGDCWLSDQDGGLVNDSEGGVIERGRVNERLQRGGAGGSGDSGPKNSGEKSPHYGRKEGRANDPREGKKFV